MHDIHFNGGTLLMFDDLRFGISWLRLEIEGEREGGEWGRTTTATAAANENLGDVKLEISGGGRGSQEMASRQYTTDRL